MRNYAPINDDKDVVTKEYVDPIKSQAAINRTTLGYQCKNLFDFKNATIGKSSTATGFDVTVCDDGSVTIKGTKPAGAWADIQIILKKRISFKNGEEYILSSENKASNVISTRLVSYKDNVLKFLGLATANNSETNIIIEESGYEVTAYMITITDTNPVDITLYPMLRYADITDGTYEPYQPSLLERCLLKDTAGIALGVASSSSITIDNLSSYTALWVNVSGNVSGINFTTNLIVPIAYLAKSTSNSVQLAGGIPSSAYITSEGVQAAKNMDGTITAKVSGNTLSLTIGTGTIGSIEVVSLM